MEHYLLTFGLITLKQSSKCWGQSLLKAGRWALLGKPKDAAAVKPSNAGGSTLCVAEFLADYLGLTNNEDDRD